MWNRSNCECESHTSCAVGEYLDYENCNCRKKLVDKVIGRRSGEECTENIYEVKIDEMALYDHGNECVFPYATCVVLAVIALAISIGTGGYFAHKYMNQWYLKKDVICVRCGTHTQTAK